MAQCDLQVPVAMVTPQAEDDPVVEGVNLGQRVLEVSCNFCECYDFTASRRAHAHKHIQTRPGAGPLEGRRRYSDRGRRQLCGCPAGHRSRPVEHAHAEIHDYPAGDGDRHVVYNRDSPAGDNNGGCAYNRDSPDTDDHGDASAGDDDRDGLAGDDDRDSPADYDNRDRDCYENSNSDGGTSGVHVNCSSSTRNGNNYTSGQHGY